MHIPDGYLSPETCIVLYGAAAPFWYKASQRLKRAITSKMVPMLSIFAAFSFTIQMLNVPVPGGTTAHAVGGTLMAIVLGPWAAIIGMSVTLAIQALFFGDGGITTLGANIFNMGIALPLTGIAAYRLLCWGKPSDKRKAIAAAIGSYVGINVAGLLVGVELGIQPIFWTVNGRPLYSPYGLSTTIPAIAIAHLTLAGFAEALLTGLALAYLMRAYPHLLPKEEQKGVSAIQKPGIARGLLAVLALFVLLSPLGLLASGGAFSEWSADQLQQLVGYVPAGFNGLSEVWKIAPFANYQWLGQGKGEGFFDLAPGYVLSAIVGIGLIFVSVMALRIALVRGESLGESGDVDEQTRSVSHRGPVISSSAPLASLSAIIGRVTFRLFSWRQGRPSFISKTISAITQTLERTIFSAEHARLPGLLQGIDPRAKLLAILLLLLATGFARHFIVILVIYLLSLLLARLSLLPASILGKGVWLGVPLFASIVAFPAIFTVPGNALVTIPLWGDARIAVSDNGLSSAILLVARVGISVSLVLLLVLTTRWTDLLKALRVLHVPDAFVVVFGMTYRYLFLLLHAINGVFLARTSRTVGRAKASEERRWLATTTGALVNRSFKMSEDVYQAMIARGFAGDVRTLTEFRMVERDWLLVGLVIVFVASVMLLDRGIG